MSATLVARDLSMSFGARVVLDQVAITVAPPDRIGVVGPNGCGKTTLLRVLAGLVEPDDGTVTVSPRDATVGYLAQEIERRPGELTVDALARVTGIADASQELDRATAALAANKPDAADGYDVALQRWLLLGAADFPTRAEVTCGEVGLPVAALSQPLEQLSGGQAARVALAGVRLARFDIVLLDEPTNDLDFDGLDRLEQFIATRDGGVVIVSHDRSFLERTITAVVELDEHTHRAWRFDSGWLAYLEERATAHRHAVEAYETYRAERAELEDRARRQRQWAASGARRAAKRAPDHDKAQRDFLINRTEKQAAKMRITEKALARLDPVETPWQGWDLHLSIAAASRSGELVARLDGAVIERGSFRLGPIDLSIHWAERVAILGRNGSGKTTLLDALLGKVPLAAGTRHLGPGVVVGELEQARSQFTTDAPLLDTLASALEPMRLPGSELRSRLAKLGLTAEQVGRRAATLSPGERTRAVLALFTARAVNCLVLDEPTNHLDLPAIEELERALADWQGTLLMVTHDRRLLEAVSFDTTIRL